MGQAAYKHIIAQPAKCGTNRADMYPLFVFGSLALTAAPAAQTLMKSRRCIGCIVGSARWGCQYFSA